ncbi:MAG: hypothetical protein GY859_21525 [Desulfobacterales bacterium]|nr:hypothetical protein [Desulfobacterales bacterium]
MSSKPAKFSVMFGGNFSEHRVNVFCFTYLYEEYRKHLQETDFHMSTAYYVTENGEVLITPIDVAKPPDYYTREDGPVIPILDAFLDMRKREEYVYLFMEGPYGTDEKFQGLAAMLGLFGAFGSVLMVGLSRSKYHTGRIIRGNYPDIFIPRTMYIASEEHIDQAMKAFDGEEVIVKPNAMQSSLFLERFKMCAENRDRLVDLVHAIFEYDHRALVQRYIQGTEYTCYCLETADGAEIIGVKKITTPNGLFTHEVKYMINRGLKETLLKRDEERAPAIVRLKAFAKKLFVDLDFQNICRMDFIITPKDEIYFLENNVNPTFKGFGNAFKERFKPRTVIDLIKTCMENDYRRPVKKTLIAHEVDISLSPE